MSMNVGELHYTLGIEDNTRRDMDKARAALRKLEQDGAIVPIEAKADLSELQRAERELDGLESAFRGADLRTPEPVIPPADVGRVDADAAKGEAKLTDMIGGWGPAAGLAAGALGVMMAGELLDQFFGALERDRDRDRLGAALGLSDGDTMRAGRIAGQLYADAYGESLGEVNAAVEAVGSTLAPFDSWLGDDATISRLTAKALDFANVFGVDVAQAVQKAGAMVESGLARDADHAFDLMVSGIQKVPSELRGDALDAVEEYAQHFASLGISGEEAMGLIVEGSRGGRYELDKVGDSLKEFGIRATDMSAASVEAYEAAGLNAEEMSAKILEGGPAAREAMQEIARGLGRIEDPVKRANAAIALFGTPLEDMSVNDIPAFLATLGDLDGGFGDVSGAAADMGTQLNDNLATDIEGIKRKLSPSNLLDAFQTGGWSAVESQLQEGVDGLKDVWAEYGPEVRAGLSAAKDELVDWWNEDGQELLDEVGAWWDETGQPWLGEKMGEALSGAGGIALDYLKDRMTDPQWWISTITAPAAGLYADGMAQKAGEMGDATVEWVKSVPGKLLGVAAGMWDVIPAEFRRMLGEIADEWANFELTLPEFRIPGTDRTVGGGTIGMPRGDDYGSGWGDLGSSIDFGDLLPSFDGGGMVDAPIGQGVLALVHGGETIRTPAQEAALGGGTTVHAPVMVDARGITNPAAMATVLGRRMGFELAGLG